MSREVLLSRHDRNMLGWIAATNMMLFASVVAFEWTVWRGLPGGDPLPEMLAQAIAAFGVTLVCGLAVLATWVVAWFHLRHRRSAFWLVAIASIPLAALPRAYALANLDATPVGVPSAALLRLLGVFGYGVATATTVLTAFLLVRSREAEEHRRADLEQAARTIANTEAEEMRVRQVVADALHGTIQNRLVVVIAGLDRTSSDLRAQGHREWSDLVDGHVAALEELRDRDVRPLSRSLFPAAVDIGTSEAIELMMSRLPASIEYHLDLDPALRGIAATATDPLSLPERLVVLYSVEEAVTNALKHGRPDTIWVSARTEPSDPPSGGPLAPITLRVSVDDDGQGLLEDPPRLHGLARHRARLRGRGGDLALGRSPRGGGRLTFHLPLRDLHAGD